MFKPVCVPILYSGSFYLNKLKIAMHVGTMSLETKTKFEQIIAKITKKCFDLSFFTLRECYQRILKINRNSVYN